MDALDIYRFIDAQPHTVLASVSPENQPEAALVAFAVSPSLEVVFDTVRSSRKYGFLKQNPRIAFVFGWAGEVTVQYEGIAEEACGDTLAHAKAVYFGKLADAYLRETWEGICYFLVRPKWVRYQDYDQRPPFITTLTF